MNECEVQPGQAQHITTSARDKYTQPPLGVLGLLGDAAPSSGSPAALFHRWLCGGGPGVRSRLAYRSAYPAAYSCLSRAKVHPGGQAQHIMISVRDKRTHAFLRAQVLMAPCAASVIIDTPWDKYTPTSHLAPRTCHLLPSTLVLPHTSYLHLRTAQSLASLIILLILELIHAYLG